MSPHEKFDSKPIAPIDFELPSAAESSSFKLTFAHIGLIIVGIVALLMIAFISLARSVEIRGVAVNLSNTDEFFPVSANIDLPGLLKLPLGNRVLVLPGTRKVSLEAPGYIPAVQTIDVGEQRNQRFDIQMTRTPGKIAIKLAGDAPEGLAATLKIDGRDFAMLPMDEVEIPAGQQKITIEAPLYRPVTQTLFVRGKGEQQSLEVSLQAAWAEYSFSSQPVGANVYIDDKEVGQTPLAIKLDEGSHVLRMSANKYQDFEREIGVVAKQDLIIPEIQLKPANAELALSSEPAGAAVLINKVYRGTTPLDLVVAPGQEQSLQLYKAGYQIAQRSLALEPAQKEDVSLTLRADLIPVTVSVSPSDAQVVVDGSLRGQGNQTLNLSSLPHKISIRKAGYVSQNFDLIPTRTSAQVISAKLLTEEQHYWAQLPDSYTNDKGHQLKLFKNLGSVELGSSRREDGRRANEAQYKAQLTRPFYVALHETTNKQFRQFRSSHVSGNFKQKSLDANRSPAVNLSWQDAARYCNWLSKQEGLDPFYRTTKGFIAGNNVGANGYRLLTEVEWAWLARNTNSGLLTYPWGNDKHPGATRVGNFADDKAASIISFHLEGYNDGYTGPSPVGKFPPNHRGLYDLDGNVSEWLNDWYSAKGSSELKGSNALRDPLGPTEGELRVVRGASWAKGYLPQLRLAYRDSAAKGKHDIGFRIARYAGLNQKR